MIHRFVKMPHLACRKIGEETVVLDVRTRSMYALNEDGARALATLDQPRTVFEVMELCSGGASCAGAEVKQTLGFLEELAATGLLECRSDSEPIGEGLRVSVDPSDVGNEGHFPWSPRLLWQEPLSTAVHMFQTYGPLDPPCQ